LVSKNINEEHLVTSKLACLQFSWVTGFYEMKIVQCLSHQAILEDSQVSSVLQEGSEQLSEIHLTFEPTQLSSI